MWLSPSAERKSHESCSKRAGVRHVLYARASPQFPVSDSHGRSTDTIRVVKPRKSAFFPLHNHKIVRPVDMICYDKSLIVLFPSVNY